MPFKKGYTPWNKGLLGWNKGYCASEETKRKISEAKQGKPSNGVLENHIKTFGPWNKGKKFPQMIGNTNGFKKGQSAWNKGIENTAFKGNKNPNWNGGVTTENERIRHSIEYKLWEDGVFARDGYVCQKCKEPMMPYKFVAHHILNFAIYIEIRLAIDNGITFCRKCHKEFHHIYKYRNNTREQLEEFLCQR